MLTQCKVRMFYYSDFKRQCLSHALRGYNINSHNVWNWLGRSVRFYFCHLWLFLTLQCGGDHLIIDSTQEQMQWQIMWTGYNCNFASMTLNDPGWPLTLATWPTSSSPNLNTVTNYVNWVQFFGSMTPHDLWLKPIGPSVQVHPKTTASKSHQNQSSTWMLWQIMQTEFNHFGSMTPIDTWWPLTKLSKTCWSTCTIYPRTTASKSHQNRSSMMPWWKM